MSEKVLHLLSMLMQNPQAIAHVEGSDQYPSISGAIKFYQAKYGTLVAASISGLPQSAETCGSRIFAMHIHSGAHCTGNETDPFANVLTHYNPRKCLHPNHSGDLPPLFENHGYAFQVCLTDRFSVCEIIGKIIVIHSMPDDFMTQPAGNSGDKIACGEIQVIRHQRPFI